MPSFTIPKDTPITVTQGGVTVTENFGHEPVYVTWEDNRKQRTMKLKQTYEPVCMPNFPNLEGIYYDFNGPYSLDSLTNRVPAPAEDLCIPAHVSMGQSNNKEHNMSNNIYATAASVNSTIPTDQKQRDYTLGRLYELKASKKRELEIKFGLRGDETPETFHDFMDRLTSGKFTFPEDKKDKYIGTYGILDYIRWRDPSVKEDDVGFRTADAKLDEAYTTARDQVILGAADAGLKIIEDFKSATFH